MSQHRCYRIFILILLLIPILVYREKSGAFPAVQEKKFRPTWQKGVSYTHGYRQDNSLRSLKSRQSLGILSDINVEYISITPFAFQKKFDDSYIGFGVDPTDKDVIHAVKEAHRMGLKVMIKPHIWLGKRWDGNWRGTIRMPNESAWKEWFRNYRIFILHYARIAEDYNAEVFCVGTELMATAVQRKDDWRRLIKEIRTIYSGPLIYAANWWQEYSLIEFWDLLDYVGINAFFPLSDKEDASLEELKMGCELIADQLDEFNKKVNKPIIFTEVGYKSVYGTSVRPWEWSSRSPVNHQEQAECYQAVLATFWGRPWFYGLYWWKWFTDPNIGGYSNRGFTPRKKPAEKVIARWFERPAPRGFYGYFPGESEAEIAQVSTAIK